MPEESHPTGLYGILPYNYCQLYGFFPYILNQLYGFLPYMGDRDVSGHGGLLVLKATGNKWRLIGGVGRYRPTASIR